MIIGKALSTPVAVLSGWAPRAGMCLAIAVACLCLFNEAAVAQTAAPIDQARQMVDKGDFSAAYDLLAPLEAERAGNVDFDFLLGAAAVNVGEATRAVFALERVLTVRPGDAIARALLARAYLQLGETGNARGELAVVQNQPLPDDARKAIERFLNTIDQLSDTGKPRLDGYIDAGVGYDTNVNGGPAISQVAIPAFTGLVLPLPNTFNALKSGFASLGGGISGRYPINEGMALVGGASLNGRFNESYSQFNTAVVDINGGAVWRRRREVFGLTAQFNSISVDGTRFREVAGITGQWQHNFDSQTKSILYLQQSQLRYPAQSIRDTDRTAVGLTMVHAMRGFNTVLFGGVYTGEEKIRDSNFLNLGHKFDGLRGGVQTQLRPTLSLFANISYEERRYGGAEFLFVATRSDRQTNTGIGLDWEFSPKWRLLPQLFLTRNSSNIPIYPVSRDVASVVLRREF